MSIAFVSGSASGNTGTVSAPSGIVAGNLLLAFVGVGSGAPTLAGWTSLYPYASSPNCTPLWKIATGSEPSSYAFAGSGNGAAVLQYSGVDPTSPIDSVGYHGYSSSTSWSCQQAQTSAANGLVVSGLYDARGGTTTIPSGQTLRESAVNVQSIYVWDQAAPSAGWYGGGSGTLVGGGGGTSVWSAMPVALLAAPGGGGSPATASGSLSLSGTVAGNAMAAATGTLTLAGTSAAKVRASAWGSLSLAGSAAAMAAFTITVVPSGATAVVSWPAVGSSYVVERDGAQVAFGVTGTSYVDTPGAGSHTYRVGVLA